MASSGQTAVSVTKVYALEDAHLVWTAAGSVYMIEEVQRVIESAIADKTQTKLASVCRSGVEDHIRKNLGPVVHSVMRECYSSALPWGNDQGRGLNQQFHPFSSDFLLLGYAKGKPWFLEISKQFELNWHTEQGFYAVGSGGEFATVAQALMAHYVDRPRSVADGLLVAYRAIATTIDVSSASVGHPVRLAKATASETRVLNDDEVREIGEAVGRWKLLEAESLEKLRLGPGPGDQAPTEDVPSMKPEDGPEG